MREGHERAAPDDRHAPVLRGAGAPAPARADGQVLADLEHVDGGEPVRRQERGVLVDQVPEEQRRPEDRVKHRRRVIVPPP